MEGRLGPRKATVSNRVSTTKDNIQSCPIVHEFIVTIIVVKSGDFETAGRGQKRASRLEWRKRYA